MFPAAVPGEGGKRTLSQLLFCFIDHKLQGMDLIAHVKPRETHEGIHEHLLGFCFYKFDHPLKNAFPVQMR